MQNRQSVHLRSRRGLKMATSWSFTLLLQQQQAPMVTQRQPHGRWQATNHSVHALTED